MKFMRFGFWLLVACSVAYNAHGQSGENYRSLLTSKVRSDKLSSSDRIKEYVENGKIRLSLRDAILLTLENDSDIQIEEMQIESSKFSLLSTYQPFDPLLQSNLNINRTSTPSYSQLQGVGQTTSALNTLSQSGLVSYTQTFTTGTNVVASISAGKSSTNSSFNFFNPYVTSNLSLQFTQPLLRNFGRFPNTAQLKIARRALSQSHSIFEAEVNDAILNVISQYWAAVQARGSLDVQRRALDLADVSYKHDKRALELGALPPLDISRSESEVASRKVQEIQADYALAQAEEALRITIGADQEPQFQSLGFELTENPQTTGDLENVNLEQVLAEALSNRPEIKSSKDAIAMDETSIRYARNQLKPDLELSGSYQSNGLGGNQYDLNTGQLIAPGGFGSSFNQLFDFGFPVYGGSLTLNFPVRNRGGQARLGSALVARTRDSYGSRQVQEQITRQVKDAVNQLNAAKLALTAAGSSYDLNKKLLAADQRKYELGA